MKVNCGRSLQRTFRTTELDSQYLLRQSGESNGGYIPRLPGSPAVPASSKASEPHLPPRWSTFRRLLRLEFIFLLRAIRDLAAASTALTSITNDLVATSISARSPVSPPAVASCEVSSLYAITTSRTLVKRAPGLGLRTLVSVSGAKEPTNVVTAIPGWGPVTKTIHLNVSIPLTGWRFMAF